jgi:hypothetical protein
VLRARARLDEVNAQISALTAREHQELWKTIAEIRAWIATRNGGS